MMDLIDSKAVLEALDELDSHQTMSRYLYRKDLANVRLGISMAVDTVEALQTVEPVRHGKWITKDVGFLQKSLICSACGGWEHNLAYKHEGMNYCPNCGAKMED